MQVKKEEEEESEKNRECRKEMMNGRKDKFSR
jgi:hypothetical protein